MGPAPSTSSWPSPANPVPGGPEGEPTGFQQLWQRKHRQDGRPELCAEQGRADSISLVLAAAQPAGQAEIILYVKDSPGGEVLRAVRRPISSLSKGDPSQYRPGTITERWETFDFDPIPATAGRKLQFSLEGARVPQENTVQVGMMYHSGYRQGEAFLDGEPVNAHVTFRAYSRGNALDYLGAVAKNLSQREPAILSNLALYLGLGALAVLLAERLVRAASRLSRPNGKV